MSSSEGRRSGYYEALQDGQEFPVFFVDDATPQWWLEVARFKSKVRADEYTSTENELLNFAGCDNFGEDPTLPPSVENPGRLGSIRDLLNNTLTLDTDAIVSAIVSALEPKLPVQEIDSTVAAALIGLDATASAMSTSLVDVKNSLGEIVALAEKAPVAEQREAHHPLKIRVFLGDDLVHVSHLTPGEQLRGITFSAVPLAADEAPVVSATEQPRSEPTEPPADPAIEQNEAAAPLEVPAPVIEHPDFILPADFEPKISTPEHQAEMAAAREILNKVIIPPAPNESKADKKESAVQRLWRHLTAMHDLGQKIDMQAAGAAAGVPKPSISWTVGQLQGSGRVKRENKIWRIVKRHPDVPMPGAVPMPPKPATLPRSHAAPVPWTIQEEQKLIELAESFMPVRGMAVIVKRSDQDIRAKMKKLGLGETDPARPPRGFSTAEHAAGQISRRCIHCNKIFTVANTDDGDCSHCGKPNVKRRAVAAGE